VKHFIVYILQCSDGSYYCGHTEGGRGHDMDQRLIEHEEGEVAYTAGRRPLKLVWQGELETLEGAVALEHQIKRWTHAEKEALIEGYQRAIAQLALSDHGLQHRVRMVPPAATATVTTAMNQVESKPTRSAVPDIQRIQSLVEAVASTDADTQRRGLAKAITLIESTRPDHRDEADVLLTQLLPRCGHSFRLGISGVPGVGKSTFIEALGLYLIGQGHRVAVLTVDPSSTVSGGSILGDKTRMEKLSVHPQAYIRPSPSSGTLGGVAEKTREALLVCEAAGYDVVIVETVGVGQSELAVANMTDMFVLMQLPNAGDDLQAIKKGVMELADLVVINKSDLDLDAATRAQAQISGALHLLGAHAPPNAAHQSAPVWQPQVMQCSALQGHGIADFWACVTRFRSQQHAGGLHADRRQQQALAWMWERIDHDLKLAFRQHPQVQALLPSLTAEVTAGRVPASTAARRLLDALKN
jgi:LAO/AO transport system kinase